MDKALDTLVLFLVLGAILWMLRHYKGQGTKTLSVRGFGDEPWDNGYVLLSQMENLLGHLKDRPMTEDQAARFCVSRAWLETRLDKATRQRIENRMLKGLAGFHGSLGESPDFTDALEDLEEKIERLRSLFDWDDVPEDERDLAHRRSQYLLEFGQRQDWIEARGLDDSYSITEEGRRALERNLFAVR
jgi:hypothetical protein